VQRDFPSFFLNHLVRAKNTQSKKKLGKLWLTRFPWSLIPNSPNVQNIQHYSAFANRMRLILTNLEISINLILTFQSCGMTQDVHLITSVIFSPAFCKFLTHFWKANVMSSYRGKRISKLVSHCLFVITVLMRWFFSLRNVFKNNLSHTFSKIHLEKAKRSTRKWCLNLSLQVFHVIYFCMPELSKSWCHSAFASRASIIWHIWGFSSSILSKPQFNNSGFCGSQ